MDHPRPAFIEWPADIRRQIDAHVETFVERAYADEALTPCVCGHTLAQHHPAQFASRCRACVQCAGFTAAAR